MSENSSDFSAFMTGLVIGGLVGATVALLIAPQSGEETREQIRVKGIEIRDRADDEIRAMRTRADAVLADVRVQADDIQARATHVVEDARKRVEGLVSSAGKQASAQESAPEIPVG